MKNFDLDDIGTAQITIGVLTLAYIGFCVLKDINPETIIAMAFTAEAALAGMKHKNKKRGE